MWLSLEFHGSLEWLRRPSPRDLGGRTVGGRRMSGLHTVERAFQLARSGDCLNIDDIRRRLKSERYSQVDEHLSSRSVRRQLLDLCNQARGQPAPTETD